MGLNRVIELIPRIKQVFLGFASTFRAPVVPSSMEPFLWH